MRWSRRPEAIGLVMALMMVAGWSDAAERPNIVVILTDDIGYGDLSCYGATKVRTPHLDRLAAGGMRFLDAHSPAAVCTPTRYSLLTGQYSFRHKPGASILSGLAPLCIPAERLTLPQLLREAGYATGVVGKWHLGLGAGETDYNVEIKPGAREVGFDESFLIPATGDRTPCVYVANGRVVNYDPADPIRVSYTEKVGNEPTGKEHPELLTVQKPSHGHDMTIVNGVSRIGWMTGGKGARWSDIDMADTITQQAVQFIEQHAAKPFFLYFATHDAHVPRIPHPRFRGTSGHGLRGDAIQECDWCVGELLAALDRLKLAENTLVVFTSDNGGVMDDGYIDGTGDDASGHRCNGALRGYKGGLYEGGHRVPFLARWPGHIPTGTVSQELICHVDLFATFAALVDRPLPQGAAPDSFNQLPTLLGTKTLAPCRTELVHQTGGVFNLALRQGPWKYLPPGGMGANAKKARNPVPPEPQLYHLGDDVAETQNLAKQHPEKVQALAARLEELRNAVQTRP
jgi:arylsulfatase A-like enzyme